MEEQIQLVSKLEICSSLLGVRDMQFNKEIPLNVHSGNFPSGKWAHSSWRTLKARVYQVPPESAPRGELLGSIPVPTSHQLRAVLAEGTDFQQFLTACQ